MMKILNYNGLYFNAEHVTAYYEVNVPQSDNSFKKGVEIVFSNGMKHVFFTESDKGVETFIASLTHYLQNNTTSPVPVNKCDENIPVKKRKAVKKDN